MRKIVLWTILASLLWGGIALASDAVPSEAVLGFGLVKTYSTDHPVILRADGEPYYANVTKFIGTDVSLAAKLKGGYSGDVPYGTLTAMSSGLRYMLTPGYGSMPGESARNFRGYNVQGIRSLTELAGQKVMWNIYTSPDVIVGAAEIPEDVSAYSMNIAKDSIVPYVKINHGSYSSSIGRIDVYFVRSGDTKPVALGNTTVNVYVNGSSIKGYYPDFVFTNFNKPVRNSFYLGRDESSMRSMTVEYEMNGARYIWNFVPQYGASSSIELGKLALENQPLTLKTGESVDIEIKIPARYNLSEYFTQDGHYGESFFLSIGNSDVLNWESGSLSFDKGTYSWNGLTYNEKKSTMSFRLIAGEPGRTALRVYIPNSGEYLREVRVTDESGDLVLSGDVPEGVYMQVSDYRVNARFVNGRPYYPSAESDGVDYALILSGDNLQHSGGYFGMTNGTKSELHEMYSDWDNKAHKYTGSYHMNSGPYYDTADSSDNTEYHTLSITEDEIENASVWVDFPNNHSFNVVSASLKSLIVSSDYMTTAEQLENFAPYFEMKHASSDVNNVVSSNWCFVNPKTMQKVSPDVSNVRVSSTRNLYSNSRSWYFQYDYKGVTYTWNFREMEYNSYGYIPSFTLKSGKSKDITVDISHSSDIEAISVNIWDTDILSADTVSFAPADTISFDAYALKEGKTRIALVFTRKGYDSSYYRYTQGYTDITVSSSDSEWTMKSPDLKPSFHAEIAFGSIIQGEPVNYNLYERPSSLNVRLLSAGTVTVDDYYKYISGKLVVTLHFYSGDVEMSSNDLYLYPNSLEYDDNGNAYMTLVSSGSYYLADNITRIAWTSSSKNISSGSADVPAIASINFKPYVKLNRDGLNVSTLEYYFVDSNDNKIATPANVSDIVVNVSTNYDSDVSNKDESGTLPLNIPEIFINGVNFAFKYNGINYSANFHPVNRSESNVISSDVISWDVSSPDLPLIMHVGDTLNVTLTAPKIQTPTAYIGNKAIVAMDVTGSADYTVKVRLTAKSAGMTSIIIAGMAAGTGEYTTEDGTTEQYTYEYYNVKYPREIWVADKNGKVPHLTGDGDIVDVIERLTSDGASSGGSSSGWYEYSDDDSESTASSDVDSGMETSDPVEVIAGLSVYPRYALPTDPSGDAYSKEWDKIYNRNLSYSAYMFEDEVDVLASRDVLTVFNEMSADLITSYPAQILAVVLPEIQFHASGIYTFRIPTDNITPKGTKIFMHANALDRDYTSPTPSIYTPDGIEVSGDAQTLTYDYSVLVSIDAKTWSVRSRDVYLPDGLGLSVDKTNASGDISQLRIYAKPDYNDAYETSERDSVNINVYNRKEDYYTGFGWGFKTSDTNIDYYADDGTELKYISGDEYINIAVYLSSGIYAPVITTKAASKDIKLINAIIHKENIPAAPAALTLTASAVSMSITLPSAGTVTLTPANATGAVTYTANYSWVAFRGNTATLTPTAAGIYSVVITAKDSAGRTAAVTIRVTAVSSTAAAEDKPASSDVNPPSSASGDKTPSKPGTDTSSGDKSGGGTSGGNEPASVTPTAPRISIQDTAIKQRIVNLLSAIVSFITGDTEIAELPEESVLSERTIADVSEEELASIPEGETPAVILPIIVVDKPAVYVFGVDLDNLEVGAYIFLHMMAESTASDAAAFYSSAENSAYTFLDDDGSETKVVPANKHVNVAAYMEPEYTYAPIITTKPSSSEEDDPSTDITTTYLSSSGGGCDSGFSFMALALLGGLGLLAKKRFMK